MSITPKAWRQMRIITIPLTRPRATFKKPMPNERASRILTYYQFQITSHPTLDEVDDSLLSRWRPEGEVVKWVTTKATDIWAGFGKANGGWKVRSLFFNALGITPIFIIVESLPSR